MASDQVTGKWSRGPILGGFTILAGLGLMTLAVVPPREPRYVNPNPRIELDDTYVLTAAIQELPTHLDPADMVSADHEFMMQMLYETLFVNRGDELHLGPQLVESWSYDPSRSEYHLFIRKGVKFWDGEELTAYHVRSNLLEWMGPAGLDAPLLYSVAGAREYHRGARDVVPAVTMRSAHEIIIQLERHDGQLLHNLTFQRFRIIKRTPSGPVGTGPFKPDRVSSGEVLLQRNPSYFAGRPGLLGVRFVLMTPEETKEALRKGSIDLTWSIVSPESPAPQGYRWIDLPAGHTVLLYLNTLFPHFDTLVKRAAVLSAVDRRAVTEQCKLGRPAETVIPPGFLGHDSSVWASVKFERIKSEIHWPRSVETIYVEDYSGHGRCIADHLTRGFEGAGIPVRARAAAFSEMESMWRAGTLPGGVEPFHFYSGRELKVFMFFSRETEEFLIGKNDDEYEHLIALTQRRDSMTAQAELLGELDRASRARAYVWPIAHERLGFLVRKTIALGGFRRFTPADWTRFGKLSELP